MFRCIGASQARRAAAMILMLALLGTGLACGESGSSILGGWLDSVLSHTVTYMVPVTGEDGNTAYEEYYPYAQAYAESYNYFIEAGIIDSSEDTPVTYEDVVAENGADYLRTCTTYRTGEEITVYKVPEKKGYTGQWLTADGKPLPETMGMTDYTVYATYAIGTYTVTVTDAGMNGDNAEPVLFTFTAEYGTPIEYPDTVQLPAPAEGWLICWSDNLPDTIPGSDTTISVEYVEGNYISYFDADGNEIFPYLQDYCDYVAYYQWYVALMNGDDSYLTMDTEKLAADVYDMYYAEAVAGNDMDMIRQFVEKGSTVGLYDVPEKEGYAGSWEGEVPDVMGTERIALHAVYTPAG